MSKELDDVLEDARRCGTGVMLDGKHIPFADFMDTGGQMTDSAYQLANKRAASELKTLDEVVERNTRMSEMTDRELDCVIEFNDFLNEPQAMYEESADVRDYRYSAYAKWSPVLEHIQSLQAALAESRAKIAGIQRNLITEMTAHGETELKLEAAQDLLTAALEKTRELEGRLSVTAPAINLCSCKNKDECEANWETEDEWCRLDYNNGIYATEPPAGGEK